MKRYLALACVLLAGLATTIPALGAQTHSVNVRDNFYDPKDLTIAKGDTVSWQWLGDSHSVTFDDGPDSGVMNRTASWSRTFDTEGTFFYQCRVHGAAMSGKVVVPRVCSGCPEPAEVWVPSEFPTIAEAVAAVADGTVINVEPGIHEVSETIQVKAADLTIRGARRVLAATASSPDPAAVSVSSGTSSQGNGTPRKSMPLLKASKKPSPSPSPSPPPPSPAPSPSPSPSPVPTWEPTLPEEVVIKARGGFASAFAVTGTGFRMSGLTIDSFRDSAIDLIGARRFRLEDLRLLINREYGIRADGVRFGVIEDVYVTGSTRAGVSIQSCELCDVNVRRITSEKNFNGFEALDAGSVVLTDSVIRSNANGVLLRTRVKPSARFQDGVQVFGNQILRSGDLQAPAPSVFRIDETQDIGAGAGIWVSGGWRNRIEGNSVSEGLYGIAMTAFGAPAFGNTITGNLVWSFDKADLAWDGLGADNCFASNRSGDGQAVTSQPPGLETTHACGGAGRPGVPDPTVQSNLLEMVVKRYYV